ncbi:MAG: PTS sugar transporter subunit IIA [Streptococcaceae bacterium]|jgi:mannose/fructose/sorbose-specific phosphotransferase system IIA component|nr:PTS sugar transporter subunit IIA [Streptococcaceae bacterium]
MARFKAGALHILKKGVKRLTETISILILTHGNLGRELINSAEMIYGATENIITVPLLPGASFEAYAEKVQAALANLPGKVILLTDLFGGTPNNIAMMLQAQRKVDVLCGINLPVLIELISLREIEPDLEKIEDHLIAAGKESIKKIVPISIDESILENF